MAVGALLTLPGTGKDYYSAFATAFCKKLLKRVVDAEVLAATLQVMATLYVSYRPL